MKRPRLAILGAHTAAAGASFDALEDMPIDVARLAPLSVIEDGFEPLSLEALGAASLVLLAMDGAAALGAAAHARKRGAIVLDLVGKLEDARYVWPLVHVPTLEPGAAYAIAPGLAGPLARVLASLVDFGPRLAVITTFESAAIAGKPGMDALTDQLRTLLAFGEPEPGALGDQLAFNVLPDASLGEDAVRAEAELMAHLRAAVGTKVPILRVARQIVASYSGEGASVELVVEGTPVLEAVEQAIAQIPGVRFGRAEAPTPQDAAQRGEILVGRLRVSAGRIAFWLVADRLRVGAGLQVQRLVARWLDQSAHSS